MTIEVHQILCETDPGPLEVKWCLLNFRGQFGTAGTATGTVSAPLVKSLKDSSCHQDFFGIYSHANYPSVESLVQENNLLDYYSRRAREYESIYAKPERQAALSKLLAWLTAELWEHNILEVACGTGYWTERIALVAHSILATDASPEVLNIARLKPYPPNRVEFEHADAYNLQKIHGNFDAAFLGFWWSHISRVDQARFLDVLHRRLSAGGKIVIIDNLYVEGSSTPIARHDRNGNSYQIRRLKDGSTHEILKNFPNPGEFDRLLASSTAEITFRTFEYFWGLSYILREIQG